MTRDEFFKWCGSRGLDDDTTIASSFDVSIHTVSSWRQQSAAYKLPTWMDVAYRENPDVSSMTRDEFFTWCDEREISGNSAIATVFSLSSQTIRNWRQRDGDFVMPPWIRLSCLGFDTLAKDGPPALPRITVGWFTTWQRRNHLKTYYDTARIFGLRRQAVHNWFKRDKLPKWLALACAGHDARVSAEACLDRGFRKDKQFKDNPAGDAAD